MRNYETLKPYRIGLNLIFFLYLIQDIVCDKKDFLLYCIHFHYAYNLK